MLTKAIQVVLLVFLIVETANPSANFRKEIIALKKEFPNQSRDTWIQFLATIGKTLNKENPQYPAVITALLPTSMPDQFAICFLKKVGVALNKAVSLNKTMDAEKNYTNFYPKILTPGTFTNASITEIRSEIELYLKNKGKALLVQDIDKFKSQNHLMVFHGICDNYNAVDVRATVIFPVRVPGNIFQNYENKWSHNRGGDISNEVLRNAWKGVVSSNVGPALVARIADAVVLLNDGDHCQDEELKEAEKSSIEVLENRERDSRSSVENTGKVALPKPLSQVPNTKMHLVSSVENDSNSASQHAEMIECSIILLLGTTEDIKRIARYLKLSLGSKLKYYLRIKQNPYTPNYVITLTSVKLQQLGQPSCLLIKKESSKYTRKLENSKYVHCLHNEMKFSLNYLEICRDNFENVSMPS